MTLDRPFPWPWPEGPRRPPLPVTDVHIWAAETPGGPGVSRQILLTLLGRYLALSPPNIALQTGAHGKISLTADAPADLRFNFSHTADLTFYVFACAREVGIDVDRLDRHPSGEKMVRRAFSEAEREALEALSQSERAAAFMRGWVRKEAYAKARGDGFQYGFPRFSVSVAREHADNLLLCDEKDPDATRNWRLQDIAVAPGLTAAWAQQGGPVSLTCWRFAG